MKYTTPTEQIRNTEKVIQDRYDYVLKKCFLKDIAYIGSCVFVDQVGFNVNFIRGQGHTIRGDQSVVSNRLKSELENSILAGISNHRIEGFEVSKVFEFTANDYIKEFVEGIMKKLDKPHYIVMNNTFINKNPIVKELFENSQHKICLTPPYSPFLNPIQVGFSKLDILIDRKPGIREHK